MLEHGSESIRARVLTDLAPEGYVPPDSLHVAAQAVRDSTLAQGVVNKQKDSGIWGANLLGVAASARAGIKAVGTIPQYRRLIELGYPRVSRPFKLANRVLFRLLSRDDDPALLFEFKKWAIDIDSTEWVRHHIRVAATATLGEAGYVEDPRIRGSAHKIATAVSNFLRGPLMENPFVRVKGANVLNPSAYPPTWYLVAMIAAMPNLRRERAGFTERLGQYLGATATRRAFTIKVGRRTIKPDYLLLGNPIDADSRGNAKDLPLALHFIEQLARLGGIPHSPAAERVLKRLIGECDTLGVWHPRRMPTIKKATHLACYHSWGLQTETKSPEGRLVEVTFRLALIAKHAGWELSYS